MKTIKECEFLEKLAKKDCEIANKLSKKRGVLLLVTLVNKFAETLKENGIICDLDLRYRTYVLAILDNYKENSELMWILITGDISKINDIR